MIANELSIPGGWVFERSVFPDARGMFVAPYQSEPFLEVLGYGLDVRQVNVSRSSRGVVRGVHFADTPPGQAKYLYCLHGSILDVIVDLRVGSPTFGEAEVVKLDAASMRSVFLSEGLGHAFMALGDDVVVGYLCSTPYNPTSERGVTPLDPDLSIPWPEGSDPVLSEKDAAAPTLEEARREGLLPEWDRCQKWYAERRQRWIG